ncbi:MAG: META domain-containing protein [Niastella sp.]|nr:META domain-containing protein [Niastella sp.]
MQNILLTGMVACALLAGSVKWNRQATGEPGLKSKKIYNQVDTLLNGEWFLLPVLASDTAAGRYPTIKFNVAKGTFTGHTGCNRMNGNFQRTDSSLTISERIMLTKMACPGYNEATFLKTLLSTNRYKREDSVLVLMFNQTELSRWTRKPYHGPIGKGT